MNQRTNESRFALWAVLAVAAPLTQYTGIGYMSVILAVAAMLPLGLVAGNGLNRMGKTLSFFQWIWMVAVLAHMLPASSGYWPAQGAELAVPVGILIMAALSNSLERSSRIAVSLFWLAVILFLGIVLGTVKKVEHQWLVPYPSEWTGELLVTLLLPSAWMMVYPETKKRAPVHAVTGVLAIGLSILMQGVLSSGVVVSTPFYETGRSIGNVGFEPMVSVAMTIGWFGFASIMLQVSVIAAKNWGLPEKAARIKTLGLTVTLLVMGLVIKGIVLVVFGILLWIIVPMTCRKNKMKKDEKRC